MEQQKFRRYSVLGQLGGWILLFLIHFMEELEYLDFGPSIAYALMAIFPLAITNYFHYYRLLPFLSQGRRKLYFPLAFLTISLGSFLNYWLVYDVPTGFIYTAEFWGIYIYTFILTLIVVAMFSLFYFVEAWYQNIQTESELRNKKLQMELSFLKSQINPHFLFNTLNNIYSYAQTGNQKTAPMLERLSSILRFMVYDCGEDTVELSREVAAVENLLEIQKMKNSEQRNIELEVEGVKAYHLIAPLIIVNFVENACKHSDVTSNPNGFIRVKVTVDSNDLCLLSISNSIKKKQAASTKYQGLGLENIRKRLELQYKDLYTMEESSKNEQYQLLLSIPLKRKQ